MKDLFKAEMLRFRLWAIAALTVHLLVLAFLTRLVDLAQQPLIVYRTFAGVYMLAGLLLGLYQMGSYRRPNVWLNLLHRPLSSWRIALALFGGGGVLLVLAVAVPMLIIAAAQAGMTARVVDLHHWLLPLAASLIALCAYLAGGLAMLGNRRWSACGLVFLVWLTVADASGWAALLLQVLTLAWLAALVVVVFKPDLSAPPRGALGTLGMALPVQMGVYLLILLLGFGAEMLWIMQGTHPNNMAVPPPGGQNETERMSGQQRLLAGLSVSTAKQAPLWREQVALSKVYGIEQLPWRLQRGELTEHVPMEFEDTRRNVRWVFSDDRMRYEGYNIASGLAVGELGVGSANATFAAPALAAGSVPGLADGDAVLVAGNTLYHYVSDSGRVWPRVRLPAGELLLGGDQVGESLVVSSPEALYFVDGAPLVRNEAPVKPRLRMPMPGPGKAGDVFNIDLMELVDGYLVSVSYTAQAGSMLGVTPYQAVVWLHDDGRSEVVARRSIHSDYGPLYRYKAWWPSPLLYAVRTVATGLFATTDPLRATSPPPIPRSMWWFAGSLMLGSLLVAGWLTRGGWLSTPRRVAWLAACAAIGVPALVSLWLLHPERVPEPAAIAEPVTA